MSGQPAGGQAPEMEQGRMGRGLDLDGGVASGVGAGLGISGVDGPRYGMRHSGPYRALRL
jgi:hypothetical protein